MVSIREQLNIDHVRYFPTDQVQFLPEALSLDLFWIISCIYVCEFGPKKTSAAGSKLSISDIILKYCVDDSLSFIKSSTGNT